MKNKTELLKEEIDNLPEELQDEVLELIKSIKKEYFNHKLNNKNDNLFKKIEDISIDMNIPDLTENHDYYIYGRDKE